MEVEGQLDTADPNVEDVEGDPFLQHPSAENRSRSQSESNDQLQRTMYKGSSSSSGTTLSWNSTAQLEAMYKMRPALCDVCLRSDDGARVYGHRIVLASAIHYFSSMFIGCANTTDTYVSMETDNLSLGPEESWGLPSTSASTSAACPPLPLSANSTTFLEQQQFEISIHNVDGRSLAELVKYCYLGRDHLAICEESVQALLAAATMLAATDVIAACADFMRARLQANNALGIAAFAEAVGCLELKEAASAYALNHFVRIYAQPGANEEYLALSTERLADLFASDYLDTGEVGEGEVLRALNVWLAVDPEARKAALPALIRHIRFPRFSPEALLSIEEEYPHLRTEPALKDLLIEALRFHLAKNSSAVGEHHGYFAHENNSSMDQASLNPSTSTSTSLPSIPTPMFDLTNARFRERIPRIRQKCLLVVGGQAPKAIRQCEYLDFTRAKWSELPPGGELPSRRCRSGIAVLNGLVYAVGGFNGQIRVRTVDVYEPKTNRWTSCASLEARRSTLGAAVLNGLLYAVGGFDGTIGLQSAEVYSPLSRTWRPIAPMSTRRSSVAVAALGGLLYAVGGYDGASRQCLASVEAYCPATDRWKTVAEMSQRRSGAGVGVLGGRRLYAIGGHDGPAVRKSVECLDTETGAWSQCADMVVARRNAGVVARDGKLYVVGGDDGQSNLASVEVYDPKANQWTLLPAEMSIGRSYAGLVLVDKAWSQ